ncbi:hypothetical protein ACFX12_038985 [Malus domestica]
MSNNEQSYIVYEPKWHMQVRQGVKSLEHYPKLGGDEIMESLAQLVCANSPSILPLPPYPLLGFYAPTNQTHVPPTFGGTTSAWWEQLQWDGFQQP